MTRDAEHTQSPQSVVVRRADLEELRDLLMERIYGSNARSPAHNARLAVEAMLAAAPAPSSLAGGEVERIARAVDPGAWAEALPIPTRADVIEFHARRQASIVVARRLAALSPEAPALNTIGCAELEVGRAVYERIEKLIDTTTGPEAEELSYLAHLAASVEEVGGYDGPEAPAREGAKLIRVVDDSGFTTLHEPDEDGGAGDLVASVWRGDYLPRLAVELSPSVAWACKTCNSPRAVDPCQKCGTALTKPADGWEWPGVPDISRIRELAREVGYAIGVHGTMERDLDLIAAPWVADAVTPFELAQHIAAGLDGEVVDHIKQDKPCGRWSCNIHTPDWTKLIDLSVMTPALTPRHEAPAEGEAVPSEWTGRGTDDDFFTPVKTAFSTPAEGAGEAMDAGFEAWLNERNLLPNGAWDWPSIVAMLNHHEDALRAHSSAPEAREEALGNLLAVIHGDGGHRALEVGTKQAALEAEKIVANLLSSAPEAREGYPSGAWGCVARLSDNTPWEAFAATEDQPDPAGAWSEIISLYTHPAAPSADKLQDALKETWDALTALREAFALDGVYDGPKGKALRLSNAAIRSAASALKTEGAK